MYSLCKNVFALYGISIAGGASQPESAPVLLKELYSYTIETSRTTLIKDVRNIEFSEDDLLCAKQLAQIDRDDNDLSYIVEPLEIKNNHYMCTSSIYNSVFGYTSELYQNEVRFSGNSTMFFWNPRDFSLKKPKYFLMNRDKSIVVLGDAESCIVIDITSKNEMFEYDEPAYKMDAINFIDEKNLIIIHYPYIPKLINNIFIRILNAKTQEKTWFLHIPHLYKFSAIAATEDLIMAGNERGIYLWERDTQALRGMIPIDNCKSIAMHPKQNICAILSYKNYTSWKTDEPHITTYLLPQRSLFKKDKMLVMLQRETPNAQFHFALY